MYFYSRQVHDEILQTYHLKDRTLGKMVVYFYVKNNVFCV